MQASDAEVAVAAAEAGAAVVRAKYGTALTRFDKFGIDFATDADVGAEQAILDVLRAARPSDGFLGEERGAAMSAGAGHTWLVDPLCGTLNYAAQTPLVAVNVALRTSGGIAVAASADPFAAEVFWTDGEGCYLRSDGTDAALTPSARSRLVEINLEPPGSDGARAQTVRMLSALTLTDVVRPRVLSTTLALAWVAAGRRAAYVSAGDLRDSVHFASGIALCQAAGCVVTGLRGQQLHTGSGGLIAAADEEIHGILQDLIAESPNRSG